MGVPKSGLRASICISMQFALLQLVAAAQVEDVSNGLQQLLQQRKGIQSYSCDALYEQSIPASRESEFRISVYLSQGRFRFDREWLKFALSEDLVGLTYKAAFDGKEVKLNSNRNSPAIDFPKSGMGSQIDLRKIGMDSRPFMANLPDEYWGEVAQFLELSGEIAAQDRTIEAEEVRLFSKKRSDGATISVFFSMDGVFRGSQSQMDDLVQRVFIERLGNFSGVSFPEVVRYRELLGTHTQRLETLRVEKLSLGVKLDDSVFELSGLGVSPGTEVHVKNASSSDGNVKLIRKVWDGNSLVDLPDLVAGKASQNGYPKGVAVLGAALLLLAVFIFIKRRRSQLG